MSASWCFRYLLLFFLFATVAQAKECDSRNHVFLIHGIGGSAKTFGVMDKYLKRADPCIVPESFVYATRDIKLSTSDFARGLDGFISSSLKKNKFTQSDRLSLVMHSQGGLIGSLWLIAIRDSNPELYAKIDSFITLSTPFFGSKMAKLGKDVFFSLAAENNNPFAPMGKIQLKDMSYGSTAILYIEENFSRIFEGNHIRFLSLSGEKAISNKDVGEGDTTVSPYSANPNHYSYDFSTGTPVENHRLGMIPYTSVKGTHIPFLSKGIAYVGRDCLVLSDCRHQGLSLVEAHLKHEAINLPKREFHKFRIHVYVKGKNKNLSVEIEDSEGKRLSARLGVHGERFSSGSFHEYAPDSLVHMMEVRLFEGQKLIRTDRVKYQGGFSTFLKY